MKQLTCLWFMITGTLRWTSRFWYDIFHHVKM